MGFPRQESWSGSPFPSPGYLPDPGIKPGSSAWQADSLPSEPPGKRPKTFRQFFLLWNTQMWETHRNNGKLQGPPLHVAHSGYQSGFAWDAMITVKLCMHCCCFSPWVSRSCRAGKPGVLQFMGSQSLTGLSNCTTTNALQICCGLGVSRTFSRLSCVPYPA